MAVHASVRIRMEDRPGALSAIGAALAANGVDIVRLDVVSHDGLDVIDDLFLAAASERDIERALTSFFTDVHVTRMSGSGEDPVVAIASVIRDVAAAPDETRAMQALVAGATALLRADRGALVVRDGTVIAGAALADLDAIELAQAFATGGTATTETASTRYVAVACGRGRALVLARPAELVFHQGEVARLAALAEAAAVVMDPAPVALAR